MKCLAYYASAFLLLLCPVFAIKYTDCGSVGSTVTDVEVSGCEGKDICPLKRGTAATLTIKFNSKSTANQLTSVVHGVIGGVPLPFPVPQPNACTGSGITCPLKNGEGYVFTQQFDVKTTYPPLQVDVKWELQDGSKTDVVCVKIPSVVT